MEKSAVEVVSRNIWRAWHADDSYSVEAVEKICAWGKQFTGSDYPPSAAEHLVRYCLETYEWLPDKTARHSAIDLARALLPQAPASLTAGKKNKKPTANERMRETLQANPESAAWSSQQWADHLNIGKSTVAETPMWKALQLDKGGVSMAAIQAAEREQGKKLGQGHKGRHKSQYND